MTRNTPDFAQAVQRNYLATWNAPTAAERRRLIDQCWSSAPTYVDPLAAAHGRDDISAVIAEVRKQFTDFVFTPVGELDAHHQQLRFQWGFGPTGAEPEVIGFDVVVVDDEGRIAEVRGFLDKVNR